MSILLRGLLAGILVTMMWSCAAVPGNSKDVGTLPTATADQATLVVYREHAEPVAMGAALQVNAQAVAMLHQHQWTWIRVAPGSYSIVAHWSAMSGQKDSHLEVQVKAGDIHFYEIVGVSRAADVTPTFAGALITVLLGSGGREVESVGAVDIIQHRCHFKQANGSEE